MRLAFLALPLPLLAVLAAPARAQDTPRHAPLILLLPAGTRALAMAGASIATRDDEVLFHGPAQLAVARGMSASWQHAGDAELRGVSAAFQTGSIGVGVGARHLHFTGAPGFPIAPVTVGAREGGEPVSSMELIAGAARPFFGVRTGVAVRIVEERTTLGRAHLTTLDVGAGRQVGPVQVGLALQHLAPDRDESGLEIRAPSRATLGFNGEGLPVGPFDLAGGASLSVDRDGRVVPRTGWELGWVWIEGHALQARLGLRRPEWDGQSPATFGLGLTRDNLSLDYAFEPSGDAPASHRVGVRVR